MECGGDWWPWVVVAQWLEHWRLKPVTWVRFPAASRFFSTFPFSACVSINTLLITLVTAVAYGTNITNFTNITIVADITYGTKITNFTNFTNFTNITLVAAVTYSTKITNFTD